MYFVSRLARRFCAVAIGGETSASASVPKKAAAAKKHRLVYDRLAKLAKSGRKIDETLSQLIMEGIPVRKQELIRYAKDLRNLRQPQRALEIFDWMEKKEMEFSVSDHAIRLDLIAKSKGLEAAENYFNSLEKDSMTKNQSIYGSLLNCYCVEREEEKAKAHFEKMVDLNFVTNSLPFDNLMAMYLRLDRPEKVAELVIAMKQKKISPCDVTYSMWIQSCGSLNDLDGAEKVIDEMKSDGREGVLSWDTFANLASIYLKAGRYDKAEPVLKSLEEKMNPNKRVSYHFLISFYAGVSNVSEVYRVWDLLKKTHPVVTNASCLTMIHALSKLGDFEGVKKIFTEWESTCWTYDMRLANVMISSYLKENMYEEAEAVLDGAMKKCKRPFSKARQLLMIHLLKKGKADLALKHFEAGVSDEDKDWTWSLELIRLFLLHFEEAKDVDGAEEFSRMLTKWSPLDSETYGLLNKIYVSAVKACPGMQKRLEEERIEVDKENTTSDS